jgi:hypothetical protein
MRRVFLGLVILLVLMLVSIAAASTDQPKDAGKQSAQVSAGHSTTAPSQASDVKPTVKGKAVLTEAEANSMRTDGERLMAQSNVNEVPVGSIDGNDLIYILVVVLLVVVILAVVH